MKRSLSIDNLTATTAESRAKQVLGEAEQEVKKQLRKAVCGDENVSVREHLTKRGKEPPVIKAIDKMSFSIGVMWMCVTEWWMLMYPENFGKFYSFSIAAFVTLRYYFYKKEKYQYFLYDFCYFVDLTCLLQVWAMPSTWHRHLDVLIPEQLRGKAAHAFFLVNFSLVSGPIAWAIPLWRNSLVFHSLDKITSIFIHFLPNLFVFCYRWFPHADGFVPDHPAKGLPSMGILEWMVYPLLVYSFWQVIYLFITEYWYQEELNQDPEIQTSLRWLTTDYQNGMNKLTRQVATRLGVMQPQEQFRPGSVKTLAIFVTAQFWYTVVTLIPVYLIFVSFHVHCAFLIFLFFTCVYNGAAYYIEVFASRYMRQFENGGYKPMHFSDEPPVAVPDSKETKACDREPKKHK